MHAALAQTDTQDFRQNDESLAVITLFLHQTNMDSLTSRLNLCEGKTP